MSACRSCGARILWAETVPAGKKIPLDVVECRPSEGGAFIVVPKGDQNFAYKLSDLAERIQATEGLGPGRGRGTAVARYESHLPHFTSCPHADAHRNRRVS